MALCATQMLIVGCGSSTESVGSSSSVAQQSQASSGTVILRTSLENVRPRAVSSTQVPAEVSQFRVTGIASSETAIYGPVVLAKASEVVLTGVPVEVIALRVELLDGAGLAIGGLSVPVRLQPGQVVNLEQPSFAFLADTSTTGGPTDSFGTFHFDAAQALSPVDYDQTLASKRISRVSPGNYQVLVSGDYLLRTTVRIGEGRDEVLQMQSDRGPLPGLPLQVQAPLRGEANRTFSRMIGLRAGDKLKLVRTRNTNPSFLSGDLAITLIGPNLKAPATQRISVGLEPRGSRNFSGRGRVTTAGRYVTFDTIGVADLNPGAGSLSYFRDTVTGLTISLPNQATESSVSADGRYFAFAQRIINDPFQFGTVFLYDRITGQSRNVSEDGDIQFSHLPRVSSDGSTVLFVGGLGSLRGQPISPEALFVAKFLNGNSTGSFSLSGSLFSLEFARSGAFDLSADGNWAAFSTGGTVYATDILNNRQYTIRTGQSCCISGDGSQIAICDSGKLFYSSPLDSGVEVADANPLFVSAMSDDGRFVVFVSSSNRATVYDHATGRLREVSYNLDGTLSNDSDVTISPDGSKIVWTSSSGGLVEGDNNVQPDVFMIDNPLFPES